LVDNAPGMVEVHVVLDQITNANSIQFGAPVPDCWTGATWLADVPTWTLFLGDTQNDASGFVTGFLGEVGGPECPGANGQIHVVKMLISVSGTGTTCCPYPIVKASADTYPEIPGPILTRNCGEQIEVHEMGRSLAYVNPDPSCDCMLAVPVQQETWGGIKALYE